MSKYPFALVDAFTTQPLSGNPCAIVFKADSLNDSQMLAIAKEMNQSETAFVLSSRSADVRARYFTPECEIPLAGHPTIATIHACLETGLISSKKRSVQLELNDGPVQVEIAGGNWFRMFQRTPIFSEVHDPNVVLPLFGLTTQDLLPNAPIQTVSTGTRQLMVPLRNHDSLKRLSLRSDPYRTYREKMKFFSPHFFCLQGISNGAQTFARHLGVPPDTMEDAFTGSATGGMAAYLWHHQLISSPKFIAEQGHWIGRPGQANVEVIGTPTSIETVIVAGQAVTVVRGELTL